MAHPHQPSVSMSLIRRPRPHHARIARAVTIGNFDGVHLGHSEILKELVSVAKQRELTPTVITFAPNPKAFFAKKANQPIPKQILTLRDKVRLLQSHGINDVVILPFHTHLANMSAQDFIKKILIDALNTQHLMVGDDFRFGAKRQGDFTLLTLEQKTHGYTLASSPTVTLEGERVSSSAIRTALAMGNLTQATQQLGHRLTLSGHIIYGQQLGRTIGIPTINLKMPEHLASHGIYAVTVALGSRTFQGVASIGHRPSVKNNGQCWLEVFIFDFKEQIYGQVAQVTLHHKIRDEAYFDNLTTLMDAIRSDIHDAESFFAANIENLKNT